VTSSHPEETQERRLIKSRGHDYIREKVVFFLESADCRQGNFFFKNNFSVIFLILELNTTLFCFISTEGKDILPTEFAMSVFTLKDGVLKDLCIPINQETQNAEEMNPPPIEDHCLEAIETLMKIIRFFKPLAFRKFPEFIFTNGNLTDDFDTFKANEGYVKSILELAGEYTVADYVKVFPLNYLLYYMGYIMNPPKNISKEDWHEHPFYSLEVADQRIKKDMDKFQSSTVSLLLV
jgi:hypothetical protein